LGLPKEGRASPDEKATSQSGEVGKNVLANVRRYRRGLLLVATRSRETAYSGCAKAAAKAKA
jgi:hypothetical protein